MMQKSRFVGRRIGRLLFGLVVLLVSCRPEVPFQYVLHVTVVDENGLPTNEVNLSLRNNKTGRSDYQYENQGVGNYTFSGLTEMGGYQLWIHDLSGDYKDSFSNVTMEEDKIVSVGFKLKRI